MTVSPQITLTSPVVKVGGTALTAAEDAAMTFMEIDLGLNLVGRATLRFIETSFDVKVAPKFALGTEVTLATLSGNTVNDLFKGEVTGIGLEHDAEMGATVLTVTIDDGAYKLGQATQNTAFLNSSYSDVIGKMVAGTGLQSSVDSTTPTHPYLLQTGTNLAYLDWIVTRCAMVWWVDYGKLMVKKISAAPSSSVATLKLGEHLSHLSTRASGRHAGKVTVTGWDEAQQAAVANVASATTTSEADLVATYPGRKAASGAGVKVSGASPLTADEAKLVSESLLAESTSAAVTTRGTCLINGTIRPFTKVEVADAGPSSGTYLVTRVQHVFRPDGFWTHFTAGPLRPEGLVDLLGGPATTAGSTIDGLLVGVVTNIDDSEGKLGRVKVKFPTISGEIESEWARVVTLGGGPKRGVVFQPEVKDEVLVGFEQGDTRRPVVLGGLFSDKNGLPTTDNVESGAVNYRRINSRVGHLIELADGTSDDKKHILLKTSNGHLVRVGEDTIEVKTASKPIKITNGDATITLTDSGDVTIEGKNVSIKATQGAVKIESASGDVAIKGMNVKAESTANLNIKAGGLGSVEATGPLTVKGATVAIN
ncbi:VgrG-related protein [Nocardioides hankookensis]|uniref:Phage baseplate assembly protein V n=1 Tax=Nocardioides hankookensis TaxID=443157 RepID=A0ABW1LGY3_9ACTN